MFRIDESPQQVLIGLGGRLGLAHDFFTRRQLFRARQSAQAGQVKFLDDLDMALLGFDQFCNASIFGSDFVGDDIAVESMQGLRQVGIGRAFALTDAHTSRLGEGVEKIVRILGIGQLDGARAQRQILELGRRTGSVIDSIEQRLRPESLHVEVAIESMVAGIIRSRLRTE